jgi:hypothetical protein
VREAERRSPDDIPEQSHDAESVVLVVLFTGEECEPLQL